MHSARSLSRAHIQPLVRNVRENHKSTLQVLSLLPLVFLYLYLGTAFGCIRVYLTNLPFRCYTPVENDPIFTQLRESNKVKGQEMVDQLLLPDRDLNTNVKRFEKPHSCKKYNADHVQYILTKQNGSNITKADFDAYINEMAAKRPGITSCGALGWQFDRSETKSSLKSHYKLVCERSILTSMMRSLGSLGQLLGSVFLCFGDVVGRSFLFFAASSIHAISGFLMIAMPEFMGFVICYMFYMGAAITLFALGFISACEFWNDKPNRRIASVALLGATFGIGIILAGQFSLYMTDWSSLLCMITSIYLVVAAGITPLIVVIANPDITSGRRQISCLQFLRLAFFPKSNVPSTPSDTPKRRASFIEVPKAYMKTSILLRLYDNQNFRFVSWLLVLNWTATTVAYYSISYYNAPMNLQLVPPTLEWMLYEAGILEAGSNLVYLAVVLLWKDRVKSYCLFLVLSGATRTFAIFFHSFPVVEFALTRIGSITVAGAFTGLYLITMELLPDCHRCTLLGISSGGGRLAGVILPQLEPYVNEIFENLIWMICGCIAVGAALSSLMISGGSNVNKLCTTFEQCVNQKMYYTMIDKDNDRIKKFVMARAERELQQELNSKMRVTYFKNKTFTGGQQQQLL